ncbi:uncharacterized protein B0P05DRAFT_464337 [Gilbertella persicaria]|uniref:uncharacterized protein n=1 Tax=Gilbertella persicaria TaxID=101096 RepID=UPI00221ED5B5|nr:uncharacterized protein B0P05DRAFT_464337 [Gilbertella persicaria]KAI8090160.1 hypothetical protein B0P05DRAFT_464337 [Gilbertella persicaria]
MEQDTPQPGPQTQSNGQPIKIRKKPGRKPNPASPALRKAQNRAAQRAFRERKERHMRELEIAIKQIREQRDKLHVENEQFKADQEILRSENWYLKGIVLTLQLVCFQHNLVIPQHGPYINEQAISVLAQSIPEPIAAYISVNASNKLPIPSKLFGYRHTMKQRDRYLSTGSIVITKDGIHSVSDRTSKTASLSVSQDSLDRLYSSDVPTEHLVHPLEQQQHDEELATTMPPLSPETHTPHPVMLAEEPLTSNLAAIQTLRLRLRLQSACVRMDSIPFAIQPTLLQLTIPHDPRIDLIPTPHMRDRMILFRDQFDLDDCFRCLLAHSVFHGGDPAIAANWQLPPEFFEKYWFLTIDYDLRRTTNKWRRLQGLGELDFKQQQKQQEEERKQVDINELHLGPMLEQYSHQQLNPTDISALLGISFGKTVSQDPKNNSSYASSLSSDSSYNTASSPSPTLRHATTVAEEEEDITPTFEPVRLTNGYNFSYSKPQPHQIKKSSGNHKSLRHHPYQQPEKEQRNSPKNTASGTCDPWDTLLVNNTSTDQQDYGKIYLTSSST